jgi:hypothetical protein
MASVSWLRWTRVCQELLNNEILSAAKTLVNSTNERDLHQAILTNELGIADCAQNRQTVPHRKIADLPQFRLFFVCDKRMNLSHTFVPLA